MPALFFSKVVPGGNPTLILHEPKVKADSLGSLSAKLMHPMHLQAEQVGALYQAGRDVPFLAMMGGEFCVNATRSAAMLLAGMGRLRAFMPVPIEKPQGYLFSETGTNRRQKRLCWRGSILVSGMPDPLEVLVCPDEESFRACIEPGNTPPDAASAPAEQSGAGSPVTDAPTGPRGDSLFWPEEMPTTLYSAARVACPPSSIFFRDLDEGLCLVHMPGMAHLLVDAERHGLPDITNEGWKEASASWRGRCGISDAPASGVVWFRKEHGRYSLWPAVEVRASASEHMETACGSASLALALMERRNKSSEGTTCAAAVEITQPSGQNLLIALPPDKGQNESASATAWIGGETRLVAQGNAYL